MMLKDSQRNVEDISPLVSVLVGSFNRPQGLHRVLDSISRQTYENIEIIVSDDCSSNLEVSDVLKNFCKLDKRVRYVIQKVNLKYFKNLNYLLGAANGQFIMWCDDDDYYEPRFIELCVRALQGKQNSETAFTYYYEAFEGGGRCSEFPDQKLILSRLSIKNPYVRLLFYLFKLDGYGYCNIYYGLHRRSVLSWFDPEEFANKYRFGSDQEFGMKATSIAPLALVKEELFIKTVSNTKEYLSDTRVATQGIKNTFLKMRQMFQEYAYDVAMMPRLLPKRYAYVLVLFSPLAFIFLMLNRVLKKIT